MINSSELGKRLSGILAQQDAPYLDTNLQPPDSNRIRLGVDDLSELLDNVPNGMDNVENNIGRIDENVSFGLTTRQALERLHHDVEIEIELMRKEFSKRKFISWLKESISFSSELSKMRWPSVVFMTGQVIAHLIVEFVLRVDNLATNWVGIQGFILAFLLIINLAINLWDTKLRSKELLIKASRISNLIVDCSRDESLLKQWKRGYRRDIKEYKSQTYFATTSPCIHTTLTYRDDTFANLPDYLLVRDDIIHLFPGDRAPGDCISVDDTSDSSKKRLMLREGQLYLEGNGSGNTTNETNEPLSSQDDNYQSKYFNHARLKNINTGLDFRMLSSPYVKSLRLSLQKSLQRPVNSVEKECFIITRKYFETYVIPMVFLLSTAITAFHYGYLDFTDSDQKIKTISIAYLLLRPSLTIMPFLPWMFPFVWMIVNAFGTARLLCCAEAQKKKNQQDSSSGYQRLPLANMKVNNLLATPTVAGGSSSACKNEDDELNDIKMDIGFKTICVEFLKLIQGTQGHVWRSSSLLQVLGSLTSLCCIDKVGILSWPNPIPEKVFIIPDNSHEEKKQQNSRFDSNNQTILHEDSESVRHDIDSKSSQRNTTLTLDQMGLNGQRNSILQGSCQNLANHNTSNYKPEIMDLSQNFSFNKNDSKYPFTLQFDDLNWHKFDNNLRPLGLAILLNNCHSESFNDYFRFHKHVVYESMLRSDLTPVVKRRCLCDLSNLIGFKGDVRKKYKFKTQIGVYKVPQSNGNLNKSAKFVTSIDSSTKLKVPFPNMTCNIHQNIGSGSHQMFTQGTADIVLDVCNEFWDGSKLVPLDDSQRKKIIDFYQRSSLTSYCTAFSYGSIMRNPIFKNHCIEISSEYSKRGYSLKKLYDEKVEAQLMNQIMTSSKKIKNQDQGYTSEDEYDLNDSDDNDRNNCALSSEPRGVRRHLSAEDLIGLLDKDKKHKFGLILEELRDQIFIGMVASQYQACPDFITLVEQLEHACIRFVHFSEENELRSRVFSEKMGLESGWNCHISLQSDNQESKTDNSSKNSIPINCFDDEQKPKSVSVNRIANILVKGRKNLDNDECGSSSISSKHTLYSWKSLPSLVMRMSARVFQSRNDHNQTQNTAPLVQTDPNNIGQDHYDNSNQRFEYGNDDADTEDIGEAEPDCDLNIENSEESEEKTNGFDSVVFDMSNRAKLPKGIENIVPHLETVDNVPLQVSLFTDCTPVLTKQMIEIMQDYGEVVCVLGSSSSVLNTPVFLQANASIAIEPLRPEFCLNKQDGNRKSQSYRKMLKKFKSQKHDTEALRPGAAHHGQVRNNNPRDRLGMGQENIIDSTRQPIKIVAQRRDSKLSSSSSSSSDSAHHRKDLDESFESMDSGSSSSSSSSDESEQLSPLTQFSNPMALASMMASLPCSYNFDRKNPVNLYALIMEARHFTFKMKNTFVCMICFALSISSAQFLASLLFLPPMFSSGLTIWLTIVVVPLMSFPLMSTTMEPQVMKIAVGKNLQLKPENITFFVICYLIKFIPSIIVVVLCFGLIIDHSCKLTGFGSSSLGPCWMFTYVKHGNDSTPDSDKQEDLLWYTHLLTAQMSSAFLIVLYFVVISSGFVHRSHLIWRRSPTTNHKWVITSIGLLIGQLIYSQLFLKSNLNSSQIPLEFLVSLPVHIWVISFMWPVIAICINLLVKRAEIKATIRQQRRARFDFNTKLGMNSPF